MRKLLVVLEGRKGVVLVLLLFGASVFGSRRSSPEGFQIDHSVRRSRQRVTGFFALNSGTFRALKTGRNGSGLIVGALKHDLETGPRVPSRSVPAQPTFAS